MSKSPQLKTSLVKLYVRLPKKIEEEQQVKILHPGIVQVTLPRQKSTRWCMIQFETSSDPDSAIKQLKEIKVDGKRLKVSHCRRKNKLQD